MACSMTPFVFSNSSLEREAAARYNDTAPKERPLDAPRVYRKNDGITLSAAAPTSSIAEMLQLKVISPLTA